MITLKNKIYREAIPFVAIGDIHDDYKQLKDLLAVISSMGLNNYRYIFLGDFFGGTKDFSKLIRLLYLIRERSDFIIGNHDLEFINLWNVAQTSSEYKLKFLRYFNLQEDEILWFISTLVTSVETPEVFLSHAGIDDLKSLSEQTLSDLTTSCYRGNLDHVTDKLVIQGHLPMEEVKNEGNHIFVDTGCGYGGFLSAFVYPERISINSKSKVIENGYEYCLKSRHS